jgi:RNA polymerase sigma factor (sigma-70 family)
VTTDSSALASEFEAARPRLRAVAYRMLGSNAEAEDAVQEAWLRLARSDSGEIQNLGGWLTTVVARVALDMLKARDRRREDALPEPVVLLDGAAVDPEAEALMADAVGLALMVVLDTLNPRERMAFVLHDLFAVPFDEIAGILGTTPAATRQLASRARRRVRGAPAGVPDADLPRQRELVAAFLAAARDGDVDALCALLAEDVVFRHDNGRELQVLSGAPEVARNAIAAAPVFSVLARSATVNGGAGVVVVADGERVIGVTGMTVVDGRIAEIDVISDPAKLREVPVPPR